MLARLVYENNFNHQVTLIFRLNTFYKYEIHY
nr:MAG TPA: hypothetical protein [Caudoviricetes sp.]